MFENILGYAVAGLEFVFVFHLLLIFADNKKAWLLLIVLYPLYNRFQPYFPSYNLSNIIYINYLTVFIFSSFIAGGLKGKLWYPKSNLMIEFLILSILYIYALISLQSVALLTINTIFLSFIIMRMTVASMFVRDEHFKRLFFRSVFYSFLLSVFIMYLEIKRFGLPFSPAMITAMAYRREAVIPGEYLSNVFSGGFHEPLQYAVWLVLIIPLFMYAYKRYGEKKYMIGIFLASLLTILIMERRPLLVLLLYGAYFVMSAKGYKFIIYTLIIIIPSAWFINAMLPTLMAAPFSHYDTLFGISIDQNAYRYIKSALSGIGHLLEYPLGTGFSPPDIVPDHITHIYNLYASPTSLTYGFPVGTGGIFLGVGFFAFIPVMYLARILFKAKGYWRYYLIPLSIGLFNFSGDLAQFHLAPSGILRVTADDIYISLYASFVVAFLLADRYHVSQRSRGTLHEIHTTTRRLDNLPTRSAQLAIKGHG
ncbi:MAG TPA: hypothetical protein ENI68_06360 [Gammaproteobacteria bacterium]|nr:hypothetical protein [Gammaproteobacteria bacterium]